MSLKRLIASHVQKLSCITAIHGKINRHTVSIILTQLTQIAIFVVQASVKLVINTSRILKQPHCKVIKSLCRNIPISHKTINCLKSKFNENRSKSVHYI